MFVWYYHSLPITQYFSHYLWAPYLSPDATFFFFFLVPKLTEPNQKKKPEHEDRTSERRRRKKKRIKQPTQEKKGKKKVKRWSKVTAEYCLWVPYVCLITILPFSYELWAKMGNYP